MGGGARRADRKTWRSRSGAAGSRRRRRRGSRRRVADASSAEDPIDLDWLRDAPREEALAYLTSLPGVGRKTAACVLIFSFGRPEIPVDTHVKRVGERLGLFRPGASCDEAHDEMLRDDAARGRL